MSTPAPYFRVLQPRTPSARFTQSSYLRLGGYVADEKDELRTLLTTTTSTTGVDEAKGGAEQQAEANKLNEKGDPAKKFSATSQAKYAYKTKATAVEVTDSAGILIYSDGELNENVAGAALQKYGKGHVTEVTTADARYSVVQGKYDLASLNGIFIKTGGLNEDGTVKKNASGEIETPANLEMTASGYIKQVAYGPLDEITYGTTRKNFHGEAYDEFHGFKETKFYGREHVYKMSGVLSMTMAAECVLKLGTKFELTGGVDLGIRLAADLKIFIGLKCDIVLIADVKIVAGYSTKIVGGSDFKIATSDMKVLSTTDMKIAPVGDAKNVGINMTIAQVDVKKVFVKADSAMGKLYQAQMDLATKDMELKQGSFSSNIRSLVLEL